MSYFLAIYGWFCNLSRLLREFFVRVKSTSSFFRGLVIQKSAVKATLRQQEIEID